MAKQLWFNQDGSGVYLAQHSTEDDNFPGWERTFGEGTYQGDYDGSSSDDFPNDDLTYVEVPEGFKATIMQNSYDAGNQGSGDKKEVLTGPTGRNLGDFDMNDMVSEIIVEDNRPPESDENGEEEGSGGYTEEELRAMEMQSQKGPNWVVLGVVGVLLLGGLYFLTRKKKPATATAPAPAPAPATATPPPTPPAS